jgi:ATP-binding cassette, subfamily B, bacterial MsbA
VVTTNHIRSSNVIDALKLAVRAMARHRWLGSIFLVSAILQGVFQSLLISALRNSLLAFSYAGVVPFSELLSASLVIFAVWVALSVSHYTGEIASISLSQRIEVESMMKVLSKLLKLPVRFFDKNSQGNVVMSSYFDLKGIRNITLEVGKLILFLTRVVGLAAAAWMMSPKLALIGLITVPFGSLPAYWLGQRITRAAVGERSLLGTLHDSFIQVSSGIRIIKTNRGEQRVEDQARKVGNELYRAIMRQARSKGISRVLLEAVSGVGLILVLTVGGSDVIAGKLDWQSLLGLLIAIMAVYSPLVGFLQSYTLICSVIPNVDRVENIMETPVEIQDSPTARPLLDAPETITLEDVAFAYDDQAVLEGLNATFKKGETIGIVGPSGSGKSTLISLLLRLYDPLRGAVYFDGTNLREIKHADLMDNSAIVMQEPFLFVDTVANNIRIGRPQATMQEVIAAAKAANIHEEILQMDQGYDSILGSRDDGRGVSGGQKQRICIASALLKNAPLLFLDEATSSLDSVSEKKVQSAIENLMQGRTTFVIAHRLSTLRNVDRILVLSRGRMVALGTHEELLETCEEYQMLWGAQFASMEGGGAS